MSKPNRINQIGFPESISEGFAIVTGTRAEQYLERHPSATEVDAYQFAKASLTSAATALRIDAVVDGEARALNVIAALPSDEQMAQGNHALSLEFVTIGGAPPIEFGDRAISAWVEDCSEELYEAVYAYFQSEMS